MYRIPATKSSTRLLILRFNEISVYFLLLFLLAVWLPQRGVRPSKIVNDLWDLVQPIMSDQPVGIAAVGPAFPLQSESINDVVLNEILFNPDSAAAGTQDCDNDGTPGEDGPGQDNAADEFVELFNQGTVSVDIGGYCLASQPAASAGSSDRWAIPAGVSISAGGRWAVCGRTGSDGTGTGFSIDDTNGDEISGFNNGGDYVTLFEPSTVGNCGSGVASIIFEIAYPDGEKDGQSYQRCADGTGTLAYQNPLSAATAPSLNGVNNCGAQAVTLDSATISRSEEGIVIEWQTVSELEHLGFHIQRREDQDPTWTQRTETLIPSPSPGAPDGQSYRWVDPTNADNAFYHYRIDAVDLQGNLHPLHELTLVVGQPFHRWLPAILAPAPAHMP